MHVKHLFRQYECVIRNLPIKLLTILSFVEQLSKVKVDSFPSIF